MKNRLPRRSARVWHLERLDDRTTPNVAFAVTATDLLIFDTSTPGTATTKAITGLAAGDSIHGLDIRPFDGKLYAMTVNDLSKEGRIYTIDGTTGAATQVGTGSFATLTSSFFGFDFNPVVDRIRIVGDTGENLRVNPNTGARADTPTNDTALNPAGSIVTSVAYDRSINFKPDAATAAPAGTVTTLFGIDSTSNKLVRIGGVDGSPSPNGGVVTAIGDLGIDVVATGNGFDIDGGSGQAFAVQSEIGKGSQLYTINLTTGAATLVGALPSDVRAFAILPSVVSGTTGNDVIELVANPTVPQSMLVTINGVPKGAFGNPTAGVMTVINADAGDDTIRITDGLQLNGVRAVGGDGTDTLDYSLWTTRVNVNLSDAAQGDFVFRATLDGTQEVPPVTTTAKGTATIVLNNKTNTYDLRMDVSGITQANLTKSHFHEGAIGVNGAVFLDLGDGTQWSVTSSGLARAVTNGAFPTGQIVNALTGGVYLNVHSAANPGGEVRGQLQLAASVNSATGFATGQVTGFENVTGGAGDDVLMGTSSANVLQGGNGVDVLLGRGGNDQLVGNKGNDQFFGDGGIDTLVWNDGDGSDLMEGGADADGVQVNAGTNDEVFTMGPNGDRYSFTRITAKTFTLDIGTSETLVLNAGTGNDTATVAPSKTLSVVVNGGDPGTAPGDKLVVNVNGVNGSTVVIPGAVSQGQYNFPDGFQSVIFNGIESFAPVATPFAVGNGAGATARVFNPDATPAFDLTPFDAAFKGGVRVAMGDVNNDGVLDVIAGTGPGIATRVIVFDGKTKGELFRVDPFEASFTGGVYVAAGDVNGDGFADFAISPDEGGGPRVRMFSGNGFGQLADFFGIEDTAFRGGARATLGDLNGDGLADLIVAAGFGGGPRIAAFDGKQLTATGGPKLFPDFFAFEVALRNGTFVATGDTNADGFADLIAGGGPGGGPRVSVFNGAQLLTNTQTRIADFFAGDVNSRGGIRVTTKNLDGDGRADIVVGAGSGAGTRVTGYLGRNLAPTGTPAEAFGFDAFTGTGGVFVG